MTEPKTETQWQSQMDFNGSFRGRVLEICDLTNIKKEELRDHWINSKYGLIYILDYVRKYKKLPLH